jgi:hypothetical protein
LTVQTLGADITLLANGTQVAHAAMGLGKGRVGVFIGGDSNQVVLERLTVRADSAPRVPETTPTAAVIIPPPISTPRVIPPTSAPASQPSGVRTPEYDLAIIQYGPVDANSPLVREMATLLDGLSALCPENRVKFADLVAGTQKAMVDRGVRESSTSILAAVRESIGTRRILATCQDYFVGHGLIQTSR